MGRSLLFDRFKEDSMRQLGLWSHPKGDEIFSTALKIVNKYCYETNDEHFYNELFNILSDLTKLTDGRRGLK